MGTRRTFIVFEGIILGFTSASPSLILLSFMADSTSRVMLTNPLRDGMLNQSSFL